MYYLTHFTTGSRDKILRDGYLRSSIESGNVKENWESEYIFFKIFDTKKLINPKNVFTTKELILSPSFLREHNAYLNIGWNGIIDKDTIKLRTKGKTKNEIQKILEDAYNLAKREFKGMKGFCHEILYKYPVDLKKNLRYIVTYKNGMPEEIRELVRKNYKKVRIIDDVDYTAVIKLI
jgi:hypothetical protein